MNFSTQKRIDGKAASAEFESTLRLLASLTAPEGLAERVQNRLRAAPAAGKARILAWPAALRIESGSWQSSLARSAAAAAIAAAVAGGGWGVYSRVQLNQAQRGIALPHVAMPSGFSSAGAMRTPQTLNRPRVARPATPAPVRRGKIASGKKVDAPTTR